MTAPARIDARQIRAALKYRLGFGYHDRHRCLEVVGCLWADFMVWTAKTLATLLNRPIRFTVPGPQYGRYTWRTYLAERVYFRVLDHINGKT